MVVQATEIPTWAEGGGTAGQPGLQWNAPKRRVRGRMNMEKKKKKDVTAKDGLNIIKIYIIYMI